MRALRRQKSVRSLTGSPCKNWEIELEHRNSIGLSDSVDPEIQFNFYSSNKKNAAALFNELEQRKTYPAHRMIEEMVFYIQRMPQIIHDRSLASLARRQAAYACFVFKLRTRKLSRFVVKFSIRIMHVTFNG
jgi:hypothetical protein